MIRIKAVSGRWAVGGGGAFRTLSESSCGGEVLASRKLSFEWAHRHEVVADIANAQS